MKHVLGDPSFNIERHFCWIERAMAEKPEFIGFPEFSLTGWVEKPEQCLTMGSGPLRKLEDLGRKFGVYLAAGFVEKRSNRLFNSCLITGPAGRVGVMRKINLIARESRFYEPGREFPVFEVAGCRMGVATCADATRFEMMNLLSLRGAEIIFAPHANSLNSYGNNASGWVKWRSERWPLFARDACVAIAGVSCAGLFQKSIPGEKETKYSGGGMVMDCRGNVTMKAGGKSKREALIVADIDLEELRQARKGHELLKNFRPSIVYNRQKGWVFGR